MPLPLYMDVHVPIVVTESLRRRGIDVLTSQEDGTARWDDEALLARATEMGRLLYSQDQAFSRIATDWQRTGRTFVGVVFASQHSASLGHLADNLELILTCCEPEELRDRIIYLPLR